MPRHFDCMCRPLSIASRCVVMTTDFALGMFHRERTHAIAAYRQFVAERVERLSPLHECNDRRILGSDEFAGRLLGQAWRPRSRRTLDELL